MTPRKTPKRKTPGTKFWNVNLSRLPLDESLFFDYEDQEKSRICGVKLRSNQLEKWISAHKDAFDSNFESTKDAVVTWKTSPGVSSMSIQAISTTKKAGKRLLSVHFYHKCQGLMVQGHGTEWWVDKLHHELANNINSQQTRSTIKDGAQRVRDAIDNFPTVLREPTTPIQALSNDVCGTPTLPKCTTPRNLTDLEDPTSKETEEVQVLFENGAKHDDNVTTQNGESSKVTSKCADSCEAAFDELQGQFVGFVQNFNTLKDDLISKDNERDVAHAQTLKQLTTQIESTQKSLEAHIRKAISKLQSDLFKAHRDIVLQKEKQAEESTIVRGLWEERIRGMSCKVDSLSDSNAELQEVIKKQDAEITVLIDRTKDLEQMLGSCHCNLTKKETAVSQTAPPLHDNSAAANSHNVNTLQDNDAFTVNQENAANSHDDTTSHYNDTAFVNQDNNRTPIAHLKQASTDKNRTNTRPALSLNNAQNNNTQVRVFADSLFRDVDKDRAFQGKSAMLHRCSTVTAATGTIRNMTDLTTETVILHVGSNDLDNTKHLRDSVRGTVQKTRELLETTRSSFPNAQIALSQVLQRGPNHTSVLNKNIRDYNQEMLNLSKTTNIIYIKHKQLTRDRSLYLSDQIHLNPRSGTKHLVADIKRTLSPASSPGMSPTPHVPQRSKPDLPRRDFYGPTFSKHNNPAPTQHSNPAPTQHSNPAPTRHSNPAPTRYSNPAPTRHSNPASTRGGNKLNANTVPLGPRIPSRQPSTVIQTARNQTRGPQQVVKHTVSSTTLNLGTLKQFKPTWKQVGNNIRKAWNVLIS